MWWHNNEDAGDLSESSAAGWSEAQGEQLADDHAAGHHDEEPDADCWECQQ